MPDLPPETLSRADFDAHFRAAAPALWCVAAAVLGTRDGADDVVQDAAVQAIGRLDQFRCGSDFSAWMAQIVRFTAFNQLRRRRRGPVLVGADLPETEAPDPQAEAVGADGAVLAEQAAFDDQVVHCLQRLPEIQRTCLLLRTVVELSYPEISAMLQIPESTAMSHVHRARGRLAAMLRGDREQARRSS